MEYEQRIGNVSDSNLQFVNINAQKEKIIKHFKAMPNWVYWVWLISIISFALSMTCFFTFVYPYTNWDVNAVSTPFYSYFTIKVV